MLASPSKRASSKLMSIMFAPASTCCRATATASSNFPSRIKPENFGDPVTLVRSPIEVKDPPVPIV